MTDSTKPGPCAHCGCANVSTLELIYDPKLKSFACDDCGCESPEFHADDDQQRAAALAAWNRRPAATPAATDERELFEAWARPLSYYMLVKQGRYYDTNTARAWEVWQAARAQLAAPRAPQWACYITQPGESLAGIALRQLKDESRWREIRDLNASHFPDMGASDYYQVGTTLKLPLSAPASRAGRDALDARKQALEEAAAMCEKIADDYRESEGNRWPELKSDAQTGASDCEAAIRAALAGTPGAPMEQQP